MLELVSNKFYKDDQDRTIMIFIDGKDIYGFWHELMLVEPNHGALQYTSDGKSKHDDWITKEEVIHESGHLVRELSEEEMLEVKKDFEEIEENK